MASERQHPPASQASPYQQGRGLALPSWTCRMLRAWPLAAALAALRHPIASAASTDEARKRQLGFRLDARCSQVWKPLARAFAMAAAIREDLPMPVLANQDKRVAMLRGTDKHVIEDPGSCSRPWSGSCGGLDRATRALWPSAKRQSFSDLWSRTCPLEGMAGHRRSGGSADLCGRSCVSVNRLRMRRFRSRRTALGSSARFSHFT